MGVPATNLKVGTVIDFNDDLWVCVDVVHVKLSKGGGAMQAKLKNLKRGDHINHRFRSSDKIEIAFLDKKNCEYLYPDGDSFVFMDVDDYELHRVRSTPTRSRNLDRRYRTRLGGQALRPNRGCGRPVAVHPGR